MIEFELRSPAERSR